MKHIDEKEDCGRVPRVSCEPKAIAQMLGRGQWCKLAAGLGFDVTLQAEVPPDAMAAWGIDADVAARFDGLEVLAAAPSYRLLLVRGEGDYRALRRMMLAVGRVNPEQLVIWWWACQEKVTVAMVDWQDHAKPFVRRMAVDRHAPDPVGLRQWAELGIDDLAGGDLMDRASELRRHVCDVLEQEGLTRQFFREFKGALELLRTQMKHGPKAERERHDVALATLLRLVFLYFLQLRGALDGDRRFVLRGLRRARAEGDAFYATLLRPLFFDALNRPKAHRDRGARELGELPFLNGGLFEPLPIEQAHPELTWPNEVFGEVIESLLERYHFAAEELEGADEQRAVDPEMLGRVFEGLMYGESRQTSGSFYTPRDIVRQLVDEALGGHLADQTELSSTQIEAVLLGEAVEMTGAQRKELQASLDTVRIVDPAVGTGAFLLEALDALRRCRRALLSNGETVSDELADPLAEYRSVRALIHEHLFGVDIQHTAVRLCELRLWLSLLTTLPKMPIAELPPLPNLSHKVCVGNSLLAPTDLVELRSGRGSFGAWADTVDGESTHELLTRLESAQSAYLTSHGDEKAEVRRQMKAAETCLQQAMLEARRASLRRTLEPLVTLASSKDLFGDAVELTGDQERERARLEAEIGAVDDALEALAAGRESRLAFSYETRFGRLLAEGGFDIVITNPPWVRAHRIDAAQRDVLRARYRCHRRKLWPGAKRAGIRAPFGPQIDLAALFVERSLELLRDGGRLCGLVPAKLFRSLHGTALREQLADHAIVSLEDYSDADRRMFDATVYPAMLHVKKRGAARPRSQTRPCRKPRPLRLSVWSGDRRRSWQSEPEALFAAGDEPGAPWIFAEPKVKRLFEKMRAVSVPLGEVERLQPMRGLFTGCNELFVLETDEARALLGPDVEEFSREVLTGRDVRPWSAETTRRILWPYDARLELRNDLPEPLLRYFAGHTERLEARSDHRRDNPLWQMFRVKEGITSPKVVWRDLSPKLEAALAPSEVVPLNTVYFIPLRDDRQARLFTALLNSAPVRAVAYALGERARGGWRRHFAWVMRLLPVPRRFVDFLDADLETSSEAFSDILRLDRAHATSTDGLAERLSAHLFELDKDEIATLAAWRTGSSGSGKTSFGKTCSAGACKHEEVA